MSNPPQDRAPVARAVADGLAREAIDLTSRRLAKAAAEAKGQGIALGPVDEARTVVGRVQRTPYPMLQGFESAHRPGSPGVPAMYRIGFALQLAPKGRIATEADARTGKLLRFEFPAGLSGRDLAALLRGAADAVDQLADVAEAALEPAPAHQHPAGATTTSGDTEATGAPGELPPHDHRPGEPAHGTQGPTAPTGATSADQPAEPPARA